MKESTSIRQFVVGDIQTNCFALVSKGECIVIDPGAAGARIAQELQDVRVTRVIATHRHHDHVCGVAALLRACEPRPLFCIGHADAEGAQRAVELSSHVFDVAGQDLENAPKPDVLLREGDVINVGEESLRVIEAPGHTEGGIVLLGDGVAFVGDTLFAGSCGRTDLQGGDYISLMQTLQRLKEEIPPQTLLLCGHGPHTTMEQELTTNPWLMQ
ncbi:MAG: MBL fold metallo-hydrolase [Coriobacteriales bacterium]|nr:MBL fold metallo-hydrolase [Coriobacteriales bacterium]